MSPPPASWIRKIDITANLEGVHSGTPWGQIGPSGPASDESIGAPRGSSSPGFKAMSRSRSLKAAALAAAQAAASALAASAALAAVQAAAALVASALASAALASAALASAAPFANASAFVIARSIVSRSC